LLVTITAIRSLGWIDIVAKLNVLGIFRFRHYCETFDIDATIKREGIGAKRPGQRRRGTLKHFTQSGCVTYLSKTISSFSFSLRLRQGELWVKAMTCQIPTDIHTYHFLHGKPCVAFASIIRMRAGISGVLIGISLNPDSRRPKCLIARLRVENASKAMATQMCGQYALIDRV
jgi:hypothetical protein